MQLSKFVMIRWFKIKNFSPPGVNAINFRGKAIKRWIFVLYSALLRQMSPLQGLRQSIWHFNLAELTDKQLWFCKLCGAVSRQNDRLNYKEFFYHENLIIVVVAMKCNGEFPELASFQFYTKTCCLQNITLTLNYLV